MAYKSALSMGGPEPGEDQKGSAMAQTSSASEGVPNDEAMATASAGREEMASKLVHRFALWSGVAGLVPLPVVDVIAVGGLQVQMLRRLSQIYDVEFSENRGKALIAALAGSMIPATSGHRRRQHAQIRTGRRNAGCSLHNARSFRRRHLCHRRLAENGLAGAGVGSSTRTGRSLAQSIAAGCTKRNLSPSKSLK